MTFRKRLTALSALILLLTAFAAPPASAGVDRQFKKTIVLDTDGAGFETGAGGRAQISRQNGIEVFGVMVKADVPDDTLYQVVVTRRNGSEAKVGVIRIFLNHGSLKLVSSIDPSKVFPVIALAQVRVLDMEGNTVLKGSFLG